jgi:hypothetical protein
MCDENTGPLAVRVPPQSAARDFRFVVLPAVGSSAGVLCAKRHRGLSGEGVGVSEGEVSAFSQHHALQESKTWYSLDRPGYRRR